MNEAERQSLKSAIVQARWVIDLFQANFETGTELIDLYEQAKPVHTAALGIWTTVVDILRARQGLDKREPEIDAINLEELFGEKENICGN